MSLSCAYCRFLPLTFMDGSWNADRWITVAELTKCSRQTLLAAGDYQDERKWKTL